MKPWLLFLPLVIAQSVSAQQLLPAFAVDSPVLAPAGGDQVDPAAVWTGAGYFTVWSDTRDGRTADLWFRTFDALGAPLTAFSLPLLRGPRQQQKPAAASGNGAVLVAWLDDTTCTSEVKAQRLSFTGQPAGALLSISQGGCTTDRPSIAWDAASSQWLVVWGLHRGGHEVRGALVASDGTVAVSDFLITNSPTIARSAWVTALSTGGFQVAWADDRSGVSNIAVATVSVTGTASALTWVLPSASAQVAPCAAPTGAGSDVLITWLEGTSARAQQVTNAGVTVGSVTEVTTGPLVDLSCAAGPLGSVVVASADRRAPGPGVYLRTVSGSGVVSAEYDAAPRVSYFNREAPRLAVNGNDALLVVRGPWGYTTGNDALGRFVSVVGTPSADAGVFIVATGGNTVSQVNAAWDGTRYLSVWRDDDQSFAGSDSFGQLLESGTGAWGVDGGLRFSTHSANLLSYPSVGGSAAGFFVSWGDDGSAGQLRGLRVGSQGALSPSAVISDVSSYVNVHASRWLLDGWATASLKSGTLRLRRTGVNGAVVLPETTLLATGTPVEQLDSAALGEVLLTVFLARDAGFDLRGARVHADAGLLDPGGFDIAVQPVDETQPAVGAGATLFLVAWSQGGEVLASRVTLQGVVLDTPPLRVGVGPAVDQLAAVGWTGSHFLVAWQSDGDVLGARVTESGALLDATPFLIAGTPELERAPRVARGPPGEALVTWEAFSEPWGSFRALGRFFREAAVAVDAGADGGLDGESDAGTDVGSDGGVDPEVGDGGAAPHRRLTVGCSCSDGSVPLLLLALFFAGGCCPRRAALSGGGGSAARS